VAAAPPSPTRPPGGCDADRPRAYSPIVTDAKSLPPPTSPNRPGERPLPAAFLWCVVALSAAPYLLQAVLGVDLGVTPGEGPLASQPALYERLRGAFVHTILESAAIGVAGMTGLLAIAHYRVSGGVVAPILVLAFFYAGVVDATHTLVSDHLVQTRVVLSDFQPFSWAIGRLFNACILLIGVIALVSAQRRVDQLRATRFLVSWAVAFAVLTVLVIAFLLETRELPDSLRRTGIVVRPWDLLPLAIYAVIALLALPLLDRTRRSAFVQAVWASMIPAMAAQAHMAFGSALLFDHDFNAAHALKVLACAVPFAGLALDYRTARAAERRAIEERTEAEVERAHSERRLAEQRALTVELERSNRDLEQFAYIASHDLRAPLRAISNLTTWLDEDFGGALSETGREYIDLMYNRVRRLEAMITSLLEFSRVGRDRVPPVAVDTGVLVAELWEVLEIPGSIALTTDGPLPVVRGNPVVLGQVFQNLLANAIRFARSQVRVAARAAEGEWVFVVRDDGPGIDPEYQARIWNLFARLEARDEDEGTGVGLALVRRAAQGWGGEAWVESTPGDGAAFYFTLPFDGGWGARHDETGGPWPVPPGLGSAADRPERRPSGVDRPRTP